MRTARILCWRWGGGLLGVGLTGVIISAHLWRRGSEYSVLGPLMIGSLIFAAVGAPLWGQALREVLLRELLRRRSLRVRIAADTVSKDKHGYWRIWARCISPVTCEEIWVSSPLLLDDPKPFLHDGVEVMLDPRRGDVVYMLVENLTEK